MFSESVDDAGALSRIRVYGNISIKKGLYRCNNDEFTYIKNAIVENTAFYDFRGFSIFDNVNFSNVAFYNVGSTYWSVGNNGSAHFTDCTMAGTPYGVIPRNNLATDLRNKYIKATNGCLLGYNGAKPVTMQSPSFIDCTYDLAYQPLTQTYKTIAPVRMIDALVDLDKSILKCAIADRHCKVELATNISFYIDGGEGATVKIYDKDSSLSYEGTYSEGTNNELLWYDRYVVTKNPAVTGQAEVDIENTYQPFLIKIEKDGYQTLEISNITITPGQPTIIRGEMVEDIPPVYIDRSISGTLETLSLKGNIDINNEITGSVESSELSVIVSDDNITGVVEVQEISS